MSDNKELTLDDIMNDSGEVAAESNTAAETPSGEKYAPANITDIRPATDLNKTKNDAEKEVMNTILNEGVGRKISQMHENAEKLKESIIENMEEADLDAELEGTNDIEMTSKPAKNDDDLLSTDDDVKEYSFEDEDLADLEKELEDETEEETSTFSEEDLEALSEEIKQFVKPVNDKIDITKFKISNNAVSGTKALSIAAKAAAKRNSLVADWVLVDTGRVISMRSFDSDDLDKLERAQNGYRTTYNSLNDMWNLIYDHCEDENKPATRDEWLKGISSLDVPHIYAAIYRASFQDSSFIPYDCNNPECKKSFIPGATPFEDLVKYDNDETKALVKNIMDRNVIDTKFDEPELLQVSDDIVIAFSQPSIYAVIFENLGLDAETRRKFANTVYIINYISGIYVIDRDSSSLNEVMPKKFPTNSVKNVKSKILTYSKILKTLNSDQRGMITGKINSMIKDNDSKVTYKYPAVECTRCHHTTSETEADPLSLLFMRHRLTALMK